MADTLSTLSIISFVVAGISLIIAVLLWFFWKIPMVVGDLSGRTAKKSIAKMRSENEKSGVKKYKEGKINIERGKLTETMSGNKVKSFNYDDRMETGLLTENKSEIFEYEETEILVDNNKKDEFDSGILPKKRTGGKSLTIIEEVIFIHTDEVIEC